MTPCLKRHVVCIILDAEGNVLSSARNMCSPLLKLVDEWSMRQRPTCARADIKAKEEGYDPNGCGSVHAEIRAIAELPPGAKPYAAYMFGHDFCCDPCKKALKAAGVSHVTTSKGFLAL